MKKGSIVNLIKYHAEGRENCFRNEAIEIARSFDSTGDTNLAEEIMRYIAEDGLHITPDSNFESDYLRKVEVSSISSLWLPQKISNDIKGIINAINHNIGVNTFLFEGYAGSGKTEAAKQVARLLDRNLYYVDFENLIDSKLGQSNKNIAEVFKEISRLPFQDKTVVLFDEIDVIAMDRINNNDQREMGRVTSTILKELDRLSSMQNGIVLLATTNLYENFDKALSRRFDAVINFNRYEKEDLIEIAVDYFSLYVRNFDNLSKDVRLFKKILKVSNELPYPAELINIVKTSMAFSDVENNNDYLVRLYESLIGNLDQMTEKDLSKQGFTVREIEKLIGVSKSAVARKLK